MSIRLLPPNLVNQIAAGEVLERPAAAVKELVENAIDAGADQIEVHIREGGRTYIHVQDNGKGLDKADLPLAVERHATSKLAEDDLFNIRTLGFRGEALPSIGSVSRMKLLSRPAKDDLGWSLTVEGGVKKEIEPESMSFGTRVEVRDLFYATPARLKFLKAASTETGHITEMVQRLALAHPWISFTLLDDKRTILDFKKSNVAGEDSEKTLVAEEISRRAAQIFKVDFEKNAFNILHEEAGYRLWGLAGLPTFNRGNGACQYIYVNHRFVRDKVLLSAVRSAYNDLLARDRYPYVALFLDVPPALVDMNVHPAKIEVRFQEPSIVRGILVKGLKKGLTQHAHRSSSDGGEEALASMVHEVAGLERKKGPFRQPSVQPFLGSASKGTFSLPPFSRATASKTGESNFAASVSSFAVPEEAGGLHEAVGVDLPSLSPVDGRHAANGLSRDDVEAQNIDGFDSHNDSVSLQSFPLGISKAQIRKTYIVAESDDGLVLVDQHAAHERLVYEKLKLEKQQDGVRSQSLLVPAIVRCSVLEKERLLEQAPLLKNWGLVIEPFGENEIVVQAIPVLLGAIDAEKLVRDICEALHVDDPHLLEGKILEVYSSMACHGSIRAGRSLSAQEMNVLLRQIETTPYAGQCNHGRPTYVTLNWNDLEKLFGRR